MINKRFRNAVKQSNSYPGTDINSDHTLVIAKIQVRMRKLQVAKQQVKYQLRKIREDISVRKEFQLKVSNRFLKLQIFETEDIEEEWRAFEEVLNISAEETIPKIKLKKKQKWMTDSILDMMEERRKLNGKDAPKYKDLNIAIKEKYKETRLSPPSCLREYSFA